MSFIDNSDFTSINPEMESESLYETMVQEQQQGTMVLSETIDESFLTDDFVVNMLDEVEGNVPTDSVCNSLKHFPTDHDSDLMPLDIQFQDISTPASVMVHPGSFSSPVIISSGSLSSPVMTSGSLLSPVISAPGSLLYPVMASPGSSFSPVTASGSLSSPVPSPSFSECSQYSTVFSPDNPRSCQSSFAEDNNLLFVVSPSAIFSENKKAPSGKKRGRKPKSERALHQISQQKEPKKSRIYEINQPFEDKTLERKRFNAVNAKKHRELQKAARENLQTQIENIKTERDELKEEVETLRATEVEMARQLELFKNYIISQQNSTLGLLKSTTIF